MTRLFQSLPESYTGVLMIEQPPDPGSPYITNYKTTLVRKTVSRSDITKNPVINGWRSPSAYSASVTDAGMIEGLGFYPEPTVIRVPSLGSIRVQRVYSYSGYIAPVLLPSLTYGFVQNDIDGLTVKCLNDIKNQKINVSLAILEMRESVSMITKRVTALTRAARFAMGKQWKKAAAELGATGYHVRKRNSVHNGWLELSFGWAPMLQDIYGAYQVLTDPERLEGAIVVARGRRVKETQEVHAWSGDDPSGSNFHFVGRQINEYRHELKGSFWYKMNLSHVSEAASLGLLNPLAVAWERVPFSFLFDYLAPVGNVLDALDATVGMNKLGVSITRFSTVRSTVAGTPSASGKPVSGACSGRASQMIMSRSVPSSVTPTFYYKNPFSAAHAANTVALFLRNKP